MKVVVLSVFVFISGCVVAGLLFFSLQSNLNDQVIMTPIATGSPLLSSHFSINNAPALSTKGLILQLEGEVLWESRIATEPSALVAHTILQQGESLITGKDGSVTVSFAEAASLELSNNSKVDIIQTLPVDIVFLQQKGIITYQAFKSSVSIRSNRLLTTIRNGSLRINVDEKLRIVTVTVLNGQAIVAYNNANIISQTHVLNAGDSFRFESDQREGKLN